MFVFCIVLPTPSSAPSRGGGQGNLATHTVAQDCMLCLLFFAMHVILFVMHVILYSLCYAFSARHFPPRGTVGCATFPFRVGFRLFVSPPVTMAACGRVLATLVSLVIAPAFSFNSPFFVSPPHHAGGTREFFYDGLPYYSVCVSCTYFFAFFLAS